MISVLIVCPQVMRDAMVRGTKVSSKVTTHEKLEWKKISFQFLEDCKADEKEEESNFKKSTKPLDRLATFYMVHATDWQLQVSGVINGYAKFFEQNTPADCPIECRPMLIECQDSYSVNTAKIHYLANKRKSRIIGMWDFPQEAHHEA